MSNPTNPTPRPHVGNNVDVQEKFCNARLCWCKNYGVHRSKEMIDSMYCNAPVDLCWCHHADMWHQSRLGFSDKLREFNRNLLEKIYQEALFVVESENQEQLREAYNETLGIAADDEAWKAALNFFSNSYEDEEE